MDHRFQLLGAAQPLRKASAGVEGHEPSRPLGGWATTYGKLATDGRVLPTWDRDDQVMEAARELEGIDWTAYLRTGGGFWNDTHVGGRPGDRQIKIGIGTALEFHGPGSELAQDHGKVGWWTAGHLWDRNDPNSWALYTSYRPTPADLDRADYFWGLATGPLRGADRTLGFSVDGLMRTSPCRRRIIWAAVQEVALAVGPSNPDCTVEVLSKALPSVSGLDFLRPGQIGVGGLPPECGRCRCPPGVCGLARLSPLKKNAAARRQPVPREQVRPRNPGGFPAPFSITHEARMTTTPASPLDSALQMLDELGKSAPAADPTLDALAELDALNKGRDEETDDENTDDENSGDEGGAEPAEMDKGDYADMGPSDDEVEEAAKAVADFFDGFDSRLVRIEAAVGDLGLTMAKSAPDVSGLELRLTSLSKSVDDMRQTVGKLAGSFSAVMRGMVEEQRAMAKAVQNLRPVTASDSAAALNDAALASGLAARTGSAPTGNDDRTQALVEGLQKALIGGVLDNREVLRLRTAVLTNPDEVARRLAAVGVSIP